MPHKIVVLIRDDPSQTHRPVEALRIALGLSTGQNPLTIVLLDKARNLLTEDASDSIDGEILERHLPIIQELQIPIVIPEGSQKELPIDHSYSITEVSASGITSLLLEADRVLVF